MCGKKENLNSCTGCFHCNYCSKECQAKGWWEHKVICRAYKAVGHDVTDPEQVVLGLLDYARELGDSNRHESQLRVSTETLAFCKASNVQTQLMMEAMSSVGTTLRDMSRYSEAEIFAREMVAEAEKLTPIGQAHVSAFEQLSNVLFYQDKIEESRRVAHDAVERFRPCLLQETDSMLLLMEAESSALRHLDRNEEALALAYQCLALRLDVGREGPAMCYYSIGLNLTNLGRQDEAETALRTALDILQSQGKDYHANAVHTMSALVDVYRRQGRKKDAATMLKAVKDLAPQVYPKDHPHYKMFMEG
jgi:tetratricopeptide (TPR) repeat protein